LSFRQGQQVKRGQAAVEDAPIAFHIAKPTTDGIFKRVNSFNYGAAVKLGKILGRNTIP
jgi:hypothetical protein